MPLAPLSELTEDSDLGFRRLAAILRIKLIVCIQLSAADKITGIKVRFAIIDSSLCFRHPYRF